MRWRDVGAAFLAIVQDGNTSAEFMEFTGNKTKAKVHSK